MPQADLKYSADLEFDAVALLARVETTLREIDPTAGSCKGRALPLAQTHHQHLLLTVQLLPKPHRDKAYSDRVLQALTALLQEHGPAQGHASVLLEYTLVHYHSVELGQGQ